MTDQQKKSIYAKSEEPSKANEYDNTEQREKETLAFNNQFFQEISGQTKNRRNIQQKKSPRVIGVNKKKEKKEKQSRFAKRASSPTEQANVNQVSLSDFTSSISKKEEKAKESGFDFSSAAPNKETESAFDFSSAAPNKETESAFDFSSAAQNKETESAFDFSSAATNNDNESAFNFSSAAPVATQEQEQQNESAFSFIADDDQQQPPQNNEGSAFSFGNSNQPPASNGNNNQQVSEPQEDENNKPKTFASFHLKKTQQPSQKDHDASNASEEKEMESTKYDEQLSDANDDLPPSIANRFKSIKIDVEKAAKKVSQSKAMLDTANPNDVAALNLYEGNRDRLLNLLDQAIETTKEAPNLLKERESNAKNEIPNLQKNKEETTKQLSDLDVQQARDKEAIDNAKKSTESSINSLNKSYDIKYSAFSTKKNQYDLEVNQALGPIGDRLAEIEQSKSLEEKQIADLLKKVEEHKQNIAQLDAEYEEKMKIYEDTESKFSSKHDEISKEEMQLQEQRKQIDLQIKQIEAPYQSLVDAVEKREKQMKALAKKSEQIDKMIADCKTDISQCSSAAEMVTKLCNGHEQVVKNRIQTKGKIEEIKSRLNQLSQLSKPNDDQIQVLKIKSTRAADVVSASKERISILEEEKKLAISQKNFMGAKTITQQLKELQEQLTTSQKTLDESNQQIEKIGKENSQQHDQIKIAKEELEEAKYTLIENDYNYFESTVAVLDGLFELSPYGVKLLKPLQEIVLRGLNNIERPPELDPNIIKPKIEELNKKLEEAVAKEDFEAADAIQEKINKLNSQLSHS